MGRLDACLSALARAVVTDADAVITTAVEGTRRVLAAAERAGVKRAVVTSSCAAISCGHEGSEKDRPDYVFTEADWSVADKCEPYQKRCDVSRFGFA